MIAPRGACTPDRLRLKVVALTTTSLARGNSLPPKAKRALACRPSCDWRSLRSSQHLGARKLDFPRKPKAKQKVLIYQQKFGFFHFYIICARSFRSEPICVIPACAGTASVDNGGFLLSIGLDFRRCEPHAISPALFRHVFVMHGESARGKQIDSAGAGDGPERGPRQSSFSAACSASRSVSRYVWTSTMSSSWRT